MRYDVYQSQREAAEVLPNGLKVLQRETPPTALGWRPKAFKPDFKYRFNSVERRDEYVAKWVANYNASQAAKTQRQAEKKAQNTDAIKIGDIFDCAWGYDETRYDFYQVVAKTEKTVTIRQIGRKVVKDYGFVGRNLVAVTNQFIGEPLVKRPSFYSGKPWLTISSYSGASPWDGEPKYDTGGTR